MSSWSLADKLNTTNDQGGVDEVGDYQPQQYAATLALLAANNENEVRELQRLAIERVAFDTGGGMCDNKALYPAWQKQRAGECVKGEDVRFRTRPFGMRWLISRPSLEVTSQDALAFHIFWQAHHGCRQVV